MVNRFWVATGLCVLLACSSGPPTQPTPEVVASVGVTPGRDTLFALGLTRQFVAVARTASGATVSGKIFVWQSSAPAVVGVDPATGLATALTRGEATITASVDGKLGIAAVIVTQQVTTVEVSPGTAGLAAIGANQQFSAVAKDANGAVVAGVQFLWVSSDPAIATVDNTGKATAKAPGSTTVSAAGLGVPGSAVLTVTQTATQLAITALPGPVTEGLPFSAIVQIEIRDANGALVTGARNTVRLAIETNPGGGALGGTTVINAVGGIATFSGLSISHAGTGYTLTATTTGLTGATTPPLNVLLNFVRVGAGSATTCGVTASGAVYCWGQNTKGQLGDGTTTSRSLPTRVLAPAGVRFVSVSQNGRDAAPGFTVNCARSDAGAGYCWGSGALGAIGDGQLVDRLTATLVTLPSGGSFATVTAGGSHTCGGTTSGTAYCWGNGARGNLGDGTTINRPLPTLVTPPVGITFSTLTAGLSTTCATTSIGAAYCWGNNSFGQVGDGFVTDRLVPTLVVAPVGVNFATAQAGGAVSCGLTFAGAVYCWGVGSDQIGDGTNVNRLTPVPVAAPGGVTFSQLATGVFHTCALRTTGAAYCWGFNGAVQLGDGTQTNRNAPTAVIMPAGVTFTSLSVGDAHSCGITALGAMYCWGANLSGQLGDGTTGTTRSTPVRVQR